MRDYIRNRFYVRGTTCLGLFNTVIAFLFNRVLVRHVDSTGDTVLYSVKRGTDFPPIEEDHEKTL